MDQAALQDQLLSRCCCLPPSCRFFLLSQVIQVQCLETRHPCSLQLGSVSSHENSRHLVGQCHISGLASVAGVESSAFSIGEGLSAVINHTKARRQVVWETPSCTALRQDPHIDLRDVSLPDLSLHACGLYRLTDTHTHTHTDTHRERERETHTHTETDRMRSLF